MIIDTKYHPEWQTNRMDFILSKFPEGFFKDKKILELGTYNGYIGAYFQSLGADVLSVDGRQENIDEINLNFPDLKVIKKDLDCPEWDFGKFDIIINFGLFYHLEKFHKEHLVNCLKNSDILIFESVIFDSTEPEIYFRRELGDDQSLSEIGGTPSTSYINNIFKENDIKFEMFSDSRLNGGNHHYEWVENNTKINDGWARRFWICGEY